MRNANRLQPALNRLATEPAREEQLALLASIERTDADFLSCYLDLSVGRAACEARFETSLAELRQASNGIVRLDLEQAADMVRAALASVWSKPDVPDAVAIFARGSTGGQHLTILALQGAVVPRTTFYRAPDLTQLAEQQPNEAFTLVLVRRGGLQVLDIQGEQVNARAWSAFRVAAGDATAPIAPKAKRTLPVLRRALARQGDRPLVVAGDGRCLDEVIATLPARSVRRLRDVMRVPPALDQQSAIRFVRQRVLQRVGLQQQKTATRLVRAIESGGMGVTGPVSCYEALRADAVETLVIARDFSFPTIRECDDCSALHVGSHESSDCMKCGSKRLSGWSVAIELIRLACRNDVPIVVSRTDELQAVDGVGCLLREPVEIEVMPQPATERPALDLVA